MLDTIVNPTNNHWMTPVTPHVAISMRCLHVCISLCMKNHMWNVDFQGNVFSPHAREVHASMLPCRSYNVFGWIIISAPGTRFGIVCLAGMIKTIRFESPMS